MRDSLDKEIFEHIEILKSISSISDDIEAAIKAINTALSAGNKLLMFGNGGSAADAQHFAAEMVGRFLKNRKALPAIALTTDTSIITAVANDFGFDEIFKRQIEALAKPGDIVIGFSTSGNSSNVIEAFEYARANIENCKIIGFSGKDGGKMAKLCDINLFVPSENTPIIQQCHEFIYHFICKKTEESLF
ncbi:MAG: SIS domain-containing protein [Candidatus Zixiibacteriota bacterium]